MNNTDKILEPSAGNGVFYSIVHSKPVEYNNELTEEQFNQWIKEIFEWDAQKEHEKWIKEQNRLKQFGNPYGKIQKFAD